VNAAVDAIPVVVSQTAFSWTAGGVWTLVFIAVGVIVRFGPAWTKIFLDRNGQKEAHAHQVGRDNLHDCQEQLDKLSLRFDALVTKHDGMQQAFNDLKGELQGAVTAYKMLDIEVEDIKPDSMALRHARTIMSMAFTVSRPPAEVQAAAERAVIRLDATPKGELEP
jgi:hypothetical protein